MSGGRGWKNKAQSCQLCYGSCDGCLKTREKSLDLRTTYRTKNCHVDSADSCWQDVFIDSDRGSGVYIEATARPRNGDIQILGQNTVRKFVPDYGSGIDLNFEIAKSQNPTSGQNSDTIIIELSMSKRDDGNFRDLCRLEPTRRI